MFLVKFLPICLFLVAAKSFLMSLKFKTCFFILKVSYEINTIILMSFLKPCTIVRSHASRNSYGSIFLCFSAYCTYWCSRSPRCSQILQSSFHPVQDLQSEYFHSDILQDPEGISCRLLDISCIRSMHFLCFCRRNCHPLFDSLWRSLKIESKLFWSSCLEVVWFVKATKVNVNCFKPSQRR